MTYKQLVHLKFPEAKCTRSVEGGHAINANGRCLALNCPTPQAAWADAAQVLGLSTIKSNGSTIPVLKSPGVAMPAYDDLENSAETRFQVQVSVDGRWADAADGNRPTLKDAEAKMIALSESFKVVRGAVGSRLNAQLRIVKVETTVSTTEECRTL